MRAERRENRLLLIRRHTASGQAGKQIAIKKPQIGLAIGKTGESPLSRRPGQKPDEKSPAYRPGCRQNRRGSTCPWRRLSNISRRSRGPGEEAAARGPPRTDRSRPACAPPWRSRRPEPTGRHRRSCGCRSRGPIEPLRPETGEILDILSDKPGRITRIEQDGVEVDLNGRAMLFDGGGQFIVHGARDFAEIVEPRITPVEAVGILPMAHPPPRMRHDVHQG